MYNSTLIDNFIKTNNIERVFSKQNIKGYFSPFPHIIVDNIFDEKLYNILKNNFPKKELFDVNSKCMGGRYRIGNEQKTFWDFLDKTPSWALLYKSLNNINFIKLLLDPYKEFINTNSFLDYDSIKCDEERAWNNCNSKGKLSDEILNNPSNLELSFDISIAGDGYKREIHHDMPHRFFNFLIYFQDANDVGGEGGELSLYNNDLSPYNTFKPMDNKAIFFLSTPQSWHSVNKMSNTKKWRKFMYGGYSSSWQSYKKVGIWKDQNVLPPQLSKEIRDSNIQFPPGFTNQWPNVKEINDYHSLGL